MQILTKYFLAVLFFFSVCISKPVSLERASRVAINWILNKTDFKVEQVGITETFYIKDGSDTVFFVFNIQPKGFVIVSADDIANPIIMYSKEGIYRPNNLPPAFIELMERSAKEIVCARTNNLVAFKSVTEKWLELSEKHLSKKIISENGIKPLLTTKWNQSWPYNKFCPSIQNVNTLVGCAALAMAQIMKFYNFPQMGVGSNSYFHEIFDTISANFGSTTYDWADMSDFIIPPNDTKQIDAIALLCFHCGVSINAIYGLSITGGNVLRVVNALENNFRYNQEAKHLLKENFPPSDWLNLIRNELNERRPVFYYGGTISGHAFLLDGYEDANYFHVNWGWGGFSDGYFYLDKLIPYKESYNGEEGAIIRIKPDTSPLKPYIDLDKRYLKFYSGYNKSLTLNQTFTIKNLGNGILDWYMSNLTDWLDINPKSGRDSGTVSVKLNTSNLIVGKYYDTITISAQGSFNSPQKIIVELTVNIIPKNFEWCKRYEGRGNNCSNSICLDKQNNCYITGSFPRLLKFDNFQLLTFVGNDIFLAKYNKIGNLNWVKQYGGNGNDCSNSVAVDNKGNIFLAGSFMDSVDFGDTKIKSAGGSDAFIAKYNSDGNLSWVRNAGGGGEDIANNIKVDNLGNCYVTGNFQQIAFFGNERITSSGLSDIFIAKYNSIGDLVWVRQAGGIRYDDSKSLFVDNDYNIYITGSFQGSVKFDMIQITSSGESDIFIAKYSSTGSLQWVRRAGGENSDFSNSICVDNSANCYIIGNFQGTALFGNIQLTSKGGSDVFIAKYNAYGNIMWVKQFGGQLYDYGNDIILDNSGNYYVTGLFQDNLKMENTQISNFGPINIYIAKFNMSDKLEWLESFGGIETYQSSGIAIDNENNCYLTGSISYDQKSSEIFIAKLSGSTNFVSVNNEYNTPNTFLLKQNYPNPFNLTTNFEFSLPISGFTTLKIYNLLGIEITTIVSKYLISGNYKYLWNTIDIPSGVYYYRLYIDGTSPLQNKNFSEIKKLILIK